MPAGVNGRHAEVEISEIEGEMPTLIAKQDLKRWGCNLYLGSGYVDYEELDIYGADVCTGPGGHLTIDLFDITENFLDQEDSNMNEFRIPEDAQAIIIDVQADTDDAHSDETEITALFKQMYQESQNNETEDLVASA